MGIQEHIEADTEDFDSSSKEDWALAIQMAMARQDGGPVLPLMGKGFTAIANGHMTVKELVDMCLGSVSETVSRSVGEEVRERLRIRKARDCGGAQDQDSPVST